MYDLRKSGRPVIGCLPLYPPLELLHSLGLMPVILWGFPEPVSDLTLADRHIQSYACSVVRRLAQVVIAEGARLFDGLLFYNACDTLRNLPEILVEGLAGQERVPMFRLHLPMTSAGDPVVDDYLTREIAELTHDLESVFRVQFSEKRFVESVRIYSRMRELAVQCEEAVAQGRLSFSSFGRTMAAANFLPVEEQISLLKSYLATAGPASDTSRPRVVVSGILPPPPGISRLLDEGGLRVTGNDIASCFRSYASTPEGWRDVYDYYRLFYRNHFPCTTLLHTADRRIPAVLDLVSRAGAEGFVFAGEKFCEYEYFELPYLHERLREAGVQVLALEISIDGAANVETFRTRIQAFAELLAQGRPEPSLRAGV